MKRIKLHFTGFWADFECERNMFTRILRKRYDVVLDSVDPDFLICSPLGAPFEYMKYDCPRIMYSGEFLSADFTAIDYFIGYDDIQFGDRCFRLPLFLYSLSEPNTDKHEFSYDDAVCELKSKKYFCNYIFGHDTVLGKREEILEKLSRYKRVECAGTHRNNMSDGKIFNYNTKFDFMRKCKFTICAESVCYPGFTSEKIGHAFDTRTVPIYYGDPLVSTHFNENAFVNCYSFNSIDEAIERVIEIDKNDDLYIEMLCNSRYNCREYEKVVYKEFEKFLFNIFDQDKESAYRRPRFYRAEKYEAYLKEYHDLQTKLSYRFYKKTGK